MAKWCTRIVAGPPVPRQYRDGDRYWKRRSGGQDVCTMRAPTKRDRIETGMVPEPRHCAAPSPNSKE